MPFSAENKSDVGDMKKKLEKTYKNVSDTAARQAIHVWNSVYEDSKDESRAWASLYSQMNERGLTKSASQIPSASRIVAAYHTVSRKGEPETLVGSRGKTAASASAKTKALWVQEHLASTHMYNIQLNIKSISDFIDAFRESTQRIEEEGGFEDPRYLEQLVGEATGIEKATRQLNAVVEEAEKNIRDATVFRSGRFASSK